MLFWLFVVKNEIVSLLLFVLSWLIKCKGCICRVNLIFCGFVNLMLYILVFVVIYKLCWLFVIEIIEGFSLVNLFGVVSLL